MEWLAVLPILISLISPLVIWYGQQRKLEGILQVRDEHNAQQLRELRDEIHDLREQVRRSDAGVMLQKIVHLELSVEELKAWRQTSVGPYVPALIDRMKDRLESIEREIGTHDTGLRGSAHRNSNKLTELEGRLFELESRTSRGAGRHPRN